MDRPGFKTIALPSVISSAVQLREPAQRSSIMRIHQRRDQRFRTNTKTFRHGYETWREQGLMPFL